MKLNKDGTFDKRTKEYKSLSPLRRWWLDASSKRQNYDDDDDDDDDEEEDDDDFEDDEDDDDDELEDATNGEKALWFAKSIGLEILIWYFFPILWVLKYFFYAPFKWLGQLFRRPGKAIRSLLWAVCVFYATVFKLLWWIVTMPFDLGVRGDRASFKRRKARKYTAKVKWPRKVEDFWLWYLWPFEMLWWSIFALVKAIRILIGWILKRRREKALHDAAAASEQMASPLLRGTTSPTGDSSAGTDGDKPGLKEKF